MGADKNNSQTAIIVAAITVFGTLGASLFANWDKVFPPKEQSSSSTPTVETPASTATSDEPPALETLPNSSPITDGFTGFWSSEKDVTAEYLVDIILKADGTALSGELQSFNQAGEDQSPTLSIAGEFSGEQGTVDISDASGTVIGKAELTATNNTLVFKVLEAEGILNETFPTEATLYPIDAAEF